METFATKAEPAAQKQGQKRKPEEKSQENEVVGKRMTKETVATGCCNSNLAEEMPKPSNYLDIFPHAVIRNIYKYLPVEDIVNASKTSTRMNTVAAEKGTWKGKVLYISSKKSKRRYIKIIEQCPFLREVTFFPETKPPNHSTFNDPIVKSMIENLEDLHSVSAQNISCFYIHLLASKFRNLEKIHVGIRFSELPLTLEALQCCNKLRNLFFENVSTENEQFGLEWREKVTRILRDSFPALTNLDFYNLQRHLKPIDVISVLEKKKNQLLDLRFVLDEVELLQVLDIISSCTMLNLELIVTNNITFNAEVLKLLKSVELTITISEERSTDLSNMFSGISIPNVKSLEIETLQGRNDAIEGYLSKLISKFPKLQELSLLSYPGKDIDDNISKFANLKELTDLSLYGPRFLTDRGVSHFPKIASMKSLHLPGLDYKKNTIENIFKCPKLELITLPNTISRRKYTLIRKLCFENNITLYKF